MTAPKRSRSPRQATAPRTPLTVSVEDYLKAIYDLERQGGAGATNDIAARLTIAPASVTGMVKRLAEQGLVHYTRYHGVTLTVAGRRAALLTIRRHRIIESYLTQVLGYEWDRVHEEAERLEHAASDELVNRMAAAIGEPETDPHGAPIPTRDGTLTETRRRGLRALDIGVEAAVAGVNDRDPAVLRELGGLGIVPGALVTVAKVAPKDGALTVRIRRGSSSPSERTVSAPLADAVYVDETVDA
jgi:DtxR family Mn-dependent transcriptional regulator